MSCSVSPNQNTIFSTKHVLGKPINISASFEIRLLWHFHQWQKLIRFACNSKVKLIAAFFVSRQVFHWPIWQLYFQKQNSTKGGCEIPPCRKPASCSLASRLYHSKWWECVFHSSMFCCCCDHNTVLAPHYQDCPSKLIFFHSLANINKGVVYGKP